MRQSWIRPIEQVVLPALEGKLRILGFTSPDHGAGVTSVAQAAAETIARSGIKVLLLDLTQASDAAGGGHGWIPGAPGTQQGARPHAAGYDMLLAQPSADTRFLFNDGKRLRTALADELAEYAVIVVDLPPLLDASSLIINPVTAALACDKVLMVYAKGLTKRVDMAAATDLARASGIRLEGLIFNERGQPSLAREISSTIRRFAPIWPSLFGWLDRKVQSSPIFR